jgi:ABC-type multidrug transport system fused ATPase/permease subunit
LERGILFDSVSFEYRGRGEMEQPVPALRDVTLAIPAGRTTALLGPSGAGKSTLMDLIPRLRIPTAGRILFDDVPVEEIRLDALRRNVAFVSQDALMLDGTIEDNLRYGHPDADKETVVAAAKDAFAHDFILRLALGYDTMVGERGVLLSGGQKQRLALARALVGRASILLLDEPTSALDAESEQAVQQALARLQASHAVTIVIIAHRLSTVRHADHIVVLEDGRLLGSGTHDELMASAPWYRRIVRLQLGESAEGPAPRTAAGAT